MSNIFGLDKKSIKVRFASTFIANTIRFAMSFFAGMFVARTLGPADFGNFNFLLTSFTSIALLIDMGSSSAFYTFISRKKRSRGFYVYYLSWVAVQFLISLLLATVLMPEWLREATWLGHGRGIVVLSLFASFSVNQLWQITNYSGESIRATVRLQAFNVVLSLFHMTGILLIIRLGAMTVSNLFFFMGCEYVVFSLLFARKIRTGLVEPDPKDAGAETFGEVFKEFRAYCYPLIITSWASFAYSFTDNWLLQRYGGAVQQGYFGIGMRFTFLASIATTSMMKVFWKEIAESAEMKDMEKVKVLFKKVTRLLYFSAAGLSCFLIPFSKELLVWLLGPEFAAGWVSLTILLLYPLHQATGQVSTATFMALGWTKAYRNYSIGVMLVSIPVTYFVLASPDAYIGGLGLASTGIAIKMVAVTAVSVNIMVYMLSRKNNWEYDFWYQPAVLGLLLPMAFAAKYVASSLLGSALGTVSTPTLLVSASVIYLTAPLLVLYKFPRLAGLEKEEIKEAIDKVKEIIAMI